MTPEQILEKAIEKAFGSCTEKYAKSQIERDGGYRVIFSHFFAKAFARYLITEREQQARELLGLEYYSDDDWFDYVDIMNSNPHTEELKQVFLQQIVLEKEPLKYLEKFLGER